jgi:hypothetical protein
MIATILHTGDLAEQRSRSEAVIGHVDRFQPCADLHGSEPNIRVSSVQTVIPALMTLGIFGLRVERMQGAGHIR